MSLNVHYDHLKYYKQVTSKVFHFYWFKKWARSYNDAFKVSYNFHATKPSEFIEQYYIQEDLLLELNKESNK